MSALAGARVRATVLNSDQNSEDKFVTTEGLVVSVAANPASSGFPLPESWKCLVLFDGAAPGEARLLVVDAMNLAVLQLDALHPPAPGDAAEALAQAGTTIKRQQLQLVKLEDEAAGLAAEVARLKKAAKKSAPAKTGPMDEGGE